MDKTNDQTQFLIEEYKSLRSEVETRLEELRHIESFGLGGVVGIMVWVTIYGESLPTFSWFIPLLFSFACAARAYAVYAHFQSMAAYFKEVEEHFLKNSKAKGWNNKFWNTNRKGTMFHANALVWVLLIMMSIGFAFFQPHASPTQKTIEQHLPASKP